MAIYGVCYHQKTPTIYNKGSKWERQYSDFLFVQARKDNGTEMVKMLNSLIAQGETEYSKGGERLDLTNIEYFYLEESEEMY